MHIIFRSKIDQYKCKFFNYLFVIDFANNMLHPHMCSTVVDMEQQSFPPSSSTIGSNLEQDENIISEFPPDVDVSQMDFQTIKAASDTMKVKIDATVYLFMRNLILIYYIFRAILQKNSKIQFCQSDLLKLLSYLEGELQARDVVIAALKVSIH